ncbi:KilA domain-containing protein [Desulfobotulus alkaliphilus]|uniref:KilA domain-containing protein n=1 Tax=Desulfobotulus alkaliphilus TaxID=622671 RepID=A0A562QY73_9BACT|nr:KilA-N domain-containing protein [Desulfobotulus alkaliphilus]TWI61752.1 KilA domain-containing protein [Desulfobotulus alkaliphilus]
MKKRITAAASQELVINGIALTCNETGLYRLNDLHEATGGLKKHQVGNWLRSQRTQQLIVQIGEERIDGTEATASLVMDSILYVQRGGNQKAQGTYACRELAYDYASWIDPAFFVATIRAFGALADGKTAEALEIGLRKDLAKEYKPMMDALKKVRAAEGKTTEARHYTNENNMLREIVTGFPPSAYKEIWGNTPFRDLLDIEGCEMLLWLQKENTKLILRGLSYAERKEILAAGRPAQQTMVA